MKIIEITDGPILSLSDVRELPAGEVGEILVQSPSTTREYFRRAEATRLAKIPAGETFWHRMGDVGYFDDGGRLWFCGRKAHRVETPAGRLLSVCSEAIFNEHPRVFRSALVGVGEKPNQRPVMILEPEPGHLPNPGSADESAFKRELAERGAAQSFTAGIEEFLFHPALPVDVRHNFKINREQLAVWAAKKLSEEPRTK